MTHSIIALAATCVVIMLVDLFSHLGGTLG